MADTAVSLPVPNLLDLPKAELEAFVVDELGQPRFRSRQIWQWVWQKGARSFEEMTNISKEMRVVLEQRAAIVWPEVERTQESTDGTVKFLLRLADGKRIETVLIPMQDRYSQCLSTQVGCAMACTFCNTGLLGFERNLTHGEVLGQVLVGRTWLEERGRNPLKNLVFMGMGEPLLNLDTLLASLGSLSDESGLSISWRRSTVSTVGLIEPLRRLGESQLALPAISLHAPTQELRAKIMPKAARTHLDDLMAALDAYPMRPRERITFEYLLLKDVNDSIEHAEQLARLLKGRRCKVNLIAYNPTEASTYAAPGREKAEAFQKHLWGHDMTAFIRRSMGADIKAACGQLKAETKGGTKDGMEGE